MKRSYTLTNYTCRLTWTLIITPHAMPQGLPFRNTEQPSLKKKPSNIGRKFKNLADFLRNLTGDRLKNSLREFLLKNPVYTIEEFLESANYHDLSTFKHQLLIHNYYITIVL
ncbi:hypothetical protein J6590_107802 [Homalodisca vitripennis]|nr:hypothetical protein J6590_041682 [Homalodisca vitripennis]KAG8333590.1 hypothetical protein J6590_107802 [Homalodisca vitripennis]